MNESKEPLHPNPLMRRSVALRSMNPELVEKLSEIMASGFLKELAANRAKNRAIHRARMNSPIQQIPDEVLDAYEQAHKPVYAMPPEHRGDD